jgi:plastocyanin
LIAPFIRRLVPRAIRTGLGLIALGLAVAAAVTIGACGSGSSSPSSPSSPVPTATPPPGGAATFTIIAGVVSPKQVEINVGQRVAFVNNDTSAHEIASNPHPVHTDCPPINDVGGLAPGTARLTGAFTVPRTCGFHDHGQPDNTSLQGTIIIH